MEKDRVDLKLLLVDDEDEFRLATARTLSRRRFSVKEAANGEDALAEIRRERPDIVVLDLKMPGMGGIETLERIREIEPNLPVIILTGHGDLDAAIAGIKLEVVDFLQKPVDIDQLANRIRTLLERGADQPLRERTIRELMLPPSRYPKLYDNQSAAVALEVLLRAFFQPTMEGTEPGQVRSALVYDRDEKFLGLVRFVDLLKLVLPSFLEKSPYTTYFTGMFLAQCKVIGKRSIRELTEEDVSVDIDAPLIEAVHLMVNRHIINIPVVERGELVGILRDRDIIYEIALNVR